MTARTPYKYKTKQYECDTAKRAKYLSCSGSRRKILRSRMHEAQLIQ